VACSATSTGGRAGGSLDYGVVPLIQVSRLLIARLTIDYPPLQVVDGSEGLYALFRQVRVFLNLPRELLPDLLEARLARLPKSLLQDGSDDGLGCQGGEGRYQHEQDGQPYPHAYTRLEVVSSE